MRWWWWWSGAAVVALLALRVLARRRRKRAPHDDAPDARLPRPVQVHIVRELPIPPRVCFPHFPPLPPPPALARDPLATAADPPEQPTTSTNTSEYKGIPKLPLPEQWMHKRPFDYKYTSTIPRPLTQIELPESQESRAKKFSATRSPSLEKDEKSPFLSRDSDEVFGFATAMSEPPAMSPKEDDATPGGLRRFRSVSTRLNMCSVTEDGGQQERLEMQNSPRVECSSAKENSNACKFDFSPMLLSEHVSSPRFFTPPETVSPMFFAEPSPKSVYYDTVKSPKFFAETTRTDNEVPQSPRSPRALSDHQNRNNGHEMSGSPRILNANKPSPKMHSYNKENYFTFDNVSADEGACRLSPRPKRYLGRNSIEKERYTPPADKDARKYRRHHSCDTNYKNLENVSNNENNNREIEVVKTEDVINQADVDVVDCCALMDTVHLGTEKLELLAPSESIAAQMRRQRLKSISLDSDNAKIIEQNLGLPIAKQMKDQMNEAFRNQDISTSCESVERIYPKSPTERPVFQFDEQKEKTGEEPKSPDLILKKSLRQSSDTQSFLDMPRFSPKEFEITVTTEEGATTSAEFETDKKERKVKNLRNLTIDLTKHDSDLEKELLEFEQYFNKTEEKKVKTPTLKVKATSLDSSETVNLSLPQQKTLDVPQNSISVPNTPKRQIKRVLSQKTASNKIGYSNLQSTADQRRLYMKGQDSGIFLRENHASLMLYQPGTSRMGSRTMGSFDENMATEKPEINVTGYHLDPNQSLGSNLLNYKQNLSVSSTNLKTLPEGVPSDDFEPNTEEEKFGKKLHRRNSNQSLMLSLDSKYSTHSLQSSNCSLNSSGASCHNLATVRTSVSNFSLNSDSRQKKLSLERGDSNASMIVNDHLTPATRVTCSSNTNLTGETQSKNCLLQRRGSNNSLTLNILSTNNLSRHSSNSSLNKDAKPGMKKGLLERRSSNTSLTLNINNSNPQLSVNRGLSISNYNLNGSTCNLSRYNSNQSIDNPAQEPRKGILERRSSNTSLTLNISSTQEPRDIEIDESMIETNLMDLQQPRQRKSLSTENLLPKSYKTRLRINTGKCGFGSHDNLWSSSYSPDTENYPQNLTYVCGDQENELIYAFGRQEDPNFQPGFTRNITTKPLSPQSTSEDFRLYLANMQHLQNASSVLSRQKLRDLNDVFQNGYSKVKCHDTVEGQACCSGRVAGMDLGKDNPQVEIPEAEMPPCSEYQKKLLRNLHQEFWDMPTNFQEKPIVSGSHNKNRYKTILPNEHSRFILKSSEGATGECYINANFIKGHEYTKNRYIATQGPLQNTIYDYWSMVYQNHLNYRGQRPPDTGESPQLIQKVVMLTNFIENNRQKCEKYFPLELNEELVVREPANTDFLVENKSDQNSFFISNSGVINKPGYTIRKLDVRFRSEVSEDSMTVYHYWFHNWADHKCPKDVNALLNLSLDVLKDSNYDFNQRNDVVDEQCTCSDVTMADSKFVFPPLGGPKSPCEVQLNISNPLDFLTESCLPPTIIHCSAGIGRTGCLIAILNGIKQLINEQKVDVLGIVCNMRLNRGGMVQNSEQYELIHKVLCLFEQACLPVL